MLDKIDLGMGERRKEKKKEKMEKRTEKNGLGDVR